MCMQCVTPCKTCENVTYCKSCENGVLYGGSCFSFLDGCPLGSYMNVNTNSSSSPSCVKCNDICTSCTSFSVCTGCVEKYFLFNGVCQTTRPTGTTGLTDLRKCLPCQYPCS